MSLSSVMYQGLQSCLDPSTSPDTRILKLKSNSLSDSVSAITSPSSPVHHQSDENRDMGGWSFLQSLSQPKAETQKVYVHPLAKRSASTLSKQSLEMCTESLGNETGSSHDLDDICSLSFVNENADDEPAKMRPDYLGTRRTSRSVSFPPPLTSMSSSHGVQMRPYREGGRLILQAVSAPEPTSYFRAERSDGRLRLLMVKPMAPAKNEAEQEELAQEEGTFVFDEEEEENLVFDEVELARPSRSSRCNEVGLTQIGWEPFWVAT